MILDCSSYESVKVSLCDIFHTTENVLLSALDDVENGEMIDYVTLEKNLILSVTQKLGDPDDNVDVLWFHGTRVEDESSFYKSGILPKGKVREGLYSKLKSLCVGLERSGENKFYSSMAGKDLINDEGPFAFLIKNVAVNATGIFHNYTKAPEMVEDIAGCLLGENYSQLVRRFQESTTPFIVSFIAKPRGCEVPKALVFLKLIKDGASEFEAGSVANTFFDSKGETVAADRILKIERLQEST